MLNTGFSGKLVTHQCCCCPNPERFRGVHQGTLRALEFEKSPPPRVPNPSPRVPTLPILKLNLNFELETKFKFTPRVPNPPPRVPTLTLPPGSPPYQL